MGMRRSMKNEAFNRLESMKAYGQKKHLDKEKNGGKPAKNKVYGYGTMKTYKNVVAHFTNWAKGHGCRTLDDARPLVDRYLQERIDAGLSASTLNKDASALVKLYQIERSELGVELPTRYREDVTLHRSKETWEGHFSEKNNCDLVDLCRATGMRKIEIERMRPEDVQREPDGRVTVHVPLGKGGKSRDIEALTDAPWRLAEAARAEGREFVIDHIPKYAPIHQYRAEYAQTLYDREARDPATLTGHDRYCARGDRAGQWYDRDALLLVSKNLGHHREGILMSYVK